MKVSRKTNYYFTYLIYLLIILFPTISISYFYTLHTQSIAKEMLLPQLDALSYSVGSSIENTSQQFKYATSLLLSKKEVVNLDNKTLPKLIGEFLFYSPFLSNVYIVDKDSVPIYGLNNNTLLHIDYRVHIDQALGGNTGYYFTTVNKEPFLQSASPIQVGSDTVGTLVLTYTLDSLEKTLQQLSSRLDMIDIYLINDDGTILTSTNYSSMLSSPSIDILKIRQSLDYDKSFVFSFNDKDLLIGSYYFIEETQWTVLSTSSIPTERFYFLIPLLCNLIGIIFLMIFQHLKKQLLLKKVYKNNFYTQHTKWT